MLLLVQGRQRVELNSAIFPVDALGIAEVENRIALAAQEDALVVRRHEAGPPEPAEEALLWEAAAGVHDHIAREVLVHGPEAVAQPGAEAWPSGHLAAGLDVGDGRIVVDGLGEGAVHNAELLRDLRSVRQQLTDPHSAIIVFVFRELVFARGHCVGLLPGGHPGKPLPVTNLLRKRLSKHLLHLGLVVPEVVMARAAAHEQVDDALRLWLVVGSRGLAFSGEFGPEQVRHRRGAEAEGRAAKELPAGHHQVVFALGICRCHWWSLRNGFIFNRAGLKDRSPGA